MLRPGERNRLEEGINYFPAGAPRRTLFFTLASLSNAVERESSSYSGPELS